MSTNTSLDIDAIETRLAMASPGPWRVKPSDNGSIHRGTVQVEENGRMIEVIAECYCGASEGHGLRNAELIAHAPDDIKALIEEVKRLRMERLVARLSLMVWAAWYEKELEGMPYYTKSIIQKDLLPVIKGNNESVIFGGLAEWALKKGMLTADCEEITFKQVAELNHQYALELYSIVRP